MNVRPDLTSDCLAEAPLTPEQRQTWDSVREELIEARQKLIEMEQRLRTLEKEAREKEEPHAVLTRPEFNREVARMLAFDERYGGLSSVLYFDIENLADIERQDGWPVADAVIRLISDALAANIRSSDILGRLAPDEFGILLARCDNPAAWKKGESLASCLHKALENISGCTVAPVINYGAYTFRDKESAASGIKHAAESVTRHTEEGP